MYKILYFFIASVFLISCTTKSNSTSIDISESNKKWVYIGLKYDPKSDTATSYYYGQVESYLFDEIMDNGKSTKMFELSNMRYDYAKDSIADYQDSIDVGTSFFYIKDIIRIDRIKKDPLTKVKITIKAK
jgi:hypothetical protein